MQQPWFAIDVEGELQQTVGDNLRAYRLARGINQENFAYRLGLHRTYLGDIERGKRNLSLRKVEEFAAVLDIEPLSLLTPGGQ
jgi:transcriptional regulator with XRE-family HTH domain